MTRQVSYEDALCFMDRDGLDSGLDSIGLLNTLALFTPILTHMDLIASPQALENLAYHLNDHQRQILQKLAQAANRCSDADQVAEIGEALYHTQKEARRGQYNPEDMDLAFWKFMVRNRWSAFRAKASFDTAFQRDLAQLDQEMELQPVQVRNQSTDEKISATREDKLPPYKESDPVWSFERFGISCTRMPDGRTIYIGGEHEDWYDPDYYVYNDVIVIDSDLNVQIYGYPYTVFRPTDSHSATLVKDESIYIIGNLGYAGTREPGITPVYRLDCQSFQIETIATTGQNPGWIFRHAAEYVATHHAIKVTQGNVFLRWEGKRKSRPNRKTYWLDLRTNEWSCGRQPRDAETK